jgi:hypothetical protein
MHSVGGSDFPKAESASKAPFDFFAPNLVQIVTNRETRAYRQGLGKLELFQRKPVFY